jgi:hypothetical protein
VRRYAILASSIALSLPVVMLAAGLAAVEGPLRLLAYVLLPFVGIAETVGAPLMASVSPLATAIGASLVDGSLKLALGLLQYPAYGAMIQWGANRGKTSRAFGGVAAVHSISVVISVLWCD